MQRGDLKDLYRGRNKGNDGITHCELFPIGRPLNLVYHGPIALSFRASFPEFYYVPVVSLSL